MRKLAIVLLMLLCVTCVFTACDLIPTLTTYTITSEKEIYTVTVGDTVDYKSYFAITDTNGIKVEVTDAMISADDADLTKEGTFVVTCTYQNVSKTIVISVKASSSTGGDTTGGDTTGGSTGGDTTGGDSTGGDTTGGTTGGDVSKVTYTITSEKDNYEVIVGATVDYKTYFTITGSDGSTVSVTDKMISAPNADLTKEGSFTVTCSYEGASKTITFVVEENNQGGGDSTGGSTGGDSTGDTTGGDQQTADLSDVFANYSDYEDWNFKLEYTLGAEEEGIFYTLGGNAYYYDGYDFYFYDLDEEIIDYVINTEDGILYYLANEDGIYTIITEDNDEFEDCIANVDYLDLTKLGNYEFVKNGDHYSAKAPADAGDAILGAEDDCAYLTFDLYVADSKITKIVATQQDDYYNTEFTFTLEFSNYGTVTVDVSDLVTGGETGGDSTGGDSTGGETQKDIVVTFQNSTGSTTLNSTGDVTFTASRNVDGWDDTMGRGVQFSKSSSVTLTSTSTINNIKSITLDISSNKEIDVNVTVRVGSTTFTCDGKNSATFKDIDNNLLTFTNSTAVTGTVVIQVVPGAGTGKVGSVWFKSITLSATGTSSTPTKTMPSQSYNANNHEDCENLLFDAQNKYYEDSNFDSTGLNPQGNYEVLIIPVEFAEYEFTAQKLTDLNNVFNNKANTGWESVSSYYNTSSYGKLELTFKITDKVILSKDTTHYSSKNDNGASILKEALDALDDSIDFSKYDYNNDGFIDGIYIIYSAPIYGTTTYYYGDYIDDNYSYWDNDEDADEEDEYYWAYVTWYTNSRTSTKYDGKYPYTYLFASVDFMYDNNYTYFVEGTMNLDATTYIHETGHMLGLDDYYDYEDEMGSNQGLGGADMMDYTIGDHNAYSKLMLGWVNPIVVTDTTTVTISSFESSGQFIMVLLDYNGTYFSEYLLIDLYTATGLNALHAGVENSLLYYDSTTKKGADFGARIYHVDSTIDNPYSDPTYYVNDQETQYGSFTDNNNSTTTDALIKLVEADGDKNFESDTYTSNGSTTRYASADDLWQTGDVFSKIQPNYTRHDGKLINFDISFGEVTATSATITITFNTAE